MKRITVVFINFSNIYENINIDNFDNVENKDIILQTDIINNVVDIVLKTENQDNNNLENKEFIIDIIDVKNKWNIKTKIILLFLIISFLFNVICLYQKKKLKKQLQVLSLSIEEQQKKEIEQQNKKIEQQQKKIKQQKKEIEQQKKEIEDKNNAIKDKTIYITKLTLENEKNENTYSRVVEKLRKEEVTLNKNFLDNKLLYENLYKKNKDLCQKIEDNEKKYLDSITNLELKIKQENKIKDKQNLLELENIKKLNRSNEDNIKGTLKEIIEKLNSLSTKYHSYGEEYYNGEDYNDDDSNGFVFLNQTQEENIETLLKEVKALIEKNLKNLETFNENLLKK
jgi:hypothetical protein